MLKSLVIIKNNQLQEKHDHYDIGVALKSSAHVQNWLTQTSFFWKQNWNYCIEKLMPLLLLDWISAILLTVG